MLKLTVDRILILMAEEVCTDRSSSVIIAFFFKTNGRMFARTSSLSIPLEQIFGVSTHWS